MQTLDFLIPNAGPISLATKLRGYGSFLAVSEAVRALPYGRVKDPESALATLEEGRGTCSTKHRFLAALAHECGHTGVVLMLGLYEMCEANTPGVGAVLAAAGFSGIPEAHCYLMHDGRRYDFTGLPSGPASVFEALFEERSVSPDELVSTKAAYHRCALTKWARAHGIEPDRAWAIRENCIELLADSTSRTAARDAL